MDVSNLANHVNISKERQNISIKKHFLSKKVYSDFKLKTWQGQMGIVVVLPALLVTFWAGELNFLEGTKSFCDIFMSLYASQMKYSEFLYVCHILNYFEIFTYLILHLTKVYVIEKCILIASKLINLLKVYAQFRGNISYIILINMKTKYISNLNMKFCRAEKARYQVTKKLFLYSFIKYENY